MGVWRCVSHDTIGTGHDTRIQPAIISDSKHPINDFLNIHTAAASLLWQNALPETVPDYRYNQVFHHRTARLSDRKHSPRRHYNNDNCRPAAIYQALFRHKYPVQEMPLLNTVRASYRRKSIFTIPPTTIVSRTHLQIYSPKIQSAASKPAF